MIEFQEMYLHSLLSQGADRPITAARRGYIEEHERLMKFFVFINDAAAIADRNATGGLPSGMGQNPVGNPAPAFDRKTRPGTGALNELRSHADMIFQMFLSRASDNYVVYISNLLAQIFVCRPETLRNFGQ